VPVAMETDPSGREKRKATEEESWHREEVSARATERSLGDQPSASVELINKCGPPWHDDLDDHVLDTKQVEIGMQAELSSFRQMEVKEDVPYSAYEQDANPNKQLVNSRFVLVDRSKPGAPRVKARIVAQQLNLSGGTWAETFAATPTTLGQRLLLWHAAKNGWKVQTADVSTAFLHASLPAGDAVYIVPPVSLRQGTGLWKLHKALYGLRQAPRLFQEHLAKVLAKLGYTRSGADPQLYVHKVTNVMISIHADDLLVAAPEKDLDAIFTGIEKSLVLKRGEIISSTGWVRYLGREYQATPRGFRVRIQAKYYEKLLQEMGMTASRPVSTPFPGPTEHSASAKPMNAEQLRQYRRAVGEMLWMLGERPDLAFQVKELARAVSGPTRVHWATLKRVLRYVQATLDIWSSS
jgi:hypothetical protein